MHINDLNKIMNIITCKDGNEFSLLDFSQIGNTISPTIIKNTVSFDNTYNVNKAYDIFKNIINNNDIDKLEKDFKDVDYEQHIIKLNSIILAGMNMVAANGRIGMANFAIMSSYMFNIYKLNTPIENLEIIIDDNLTHIILGRKNTIDQPCINCYTDNNNMQVINSSKSAFKQYLNIYIKNIVNLRLEKLKKLLNEK